MPESEPQPDHQRLDFICVQLAALLRREAG
jgi:hypothetical protein